MRILIVVPDQDRISGNWITASRFKQGLEAHDCKVVLYGAQLDDNHLLGEQAIKVKPDVALLLHAYRTGGPWLSNKGCGEIPYVVMLTGTDLNLGLHDAEQTQVIQTVLQTARSIVVQNPLQAASFAKEHPSLAEKIHRPAPGVTLGETPYPLHKKHGLDKERPLFLCPAGIRPVKGVLELIEQLDSVIQDCSQLQMAFCGPILDQDYAEIFLPAVAKRPWAHYLGPIPPAVMASVMCEADVVLNNSRAEGLSNSLLEAATLGVPILASNIQGNATIVKHGHNGLLYNSDEEFTSCALRLLNADERAKLSRPSAGRYSCRQEAEDLYKILREAAS